MKALATILLLALTACAGLAQEAKPATPPEFAPITEDPKLPRVLLMGDSVSIAYALEVDRKSTRLNSSH